MTEIRTSDTQVAAHLLALGHSLRGVGGTRARREFIFAENVEPDRLAYFTDARPVPARKLFGAFRDLKKLLIEVQ